MIAASVAAVIVSMNRAAEARAQAEAETAAADAASAEAKKAKAESDKEADIRRAAEANAKAKADELKAKELEKEKAELDAKAASDRKEAAEAEADAEQAKADAARAAREIEQAKAEAAKNEQLRLKHLANAEESKATAEANRLAAEKVKAEAILSEAKALELRKIDFETLERDLMEWKLDLEERERALKPEKTIADLAWAGGMEDSIIDEKGNVKKQVKESYDPEKDMTLPETSRNLAKTQRITVEKHNKLGESTRNAVIASMEKLYVDAVKDNRVIDADFYRKSIKSMYPDWEFKGDSPLRDGEK